MGYRLHLYINDVVIQYLCHKHIAIQAAQIWVDAPVADMLCTVSFDKCI